MDWVQTPSWFSAPCSEHVFLETGLRGTVWPYRRREVKRGAQWVQLPEGFTSDTQVEGEETADPLCWLSKRRQKSLTGVEKLCILISLFCFVLSTNKHRGFRFLWILLCPVGLPEWCSATGQGRGERGKLGLGHSGPATGRCWAAPQ